MATEEIGLAELKRMIERHWRISLGMAVLFGLVALVWLALLSPQVYHATARLMVHPLGTDEEAKNADLYRSLLASETILQQTTDRLVSEGVLPGNGNLVLDRDVMLFIDTPRRIQAGAEDRVSAVIALTARAPDPKRAAAIANTWARVFIKQSRSMLRSAAFEREALLDEQLIPTRKELEELELERARLLDEFQEREEEIWSTWDRRITAAKNKAEVARAEYQTETRRRLDEIVAQHLPDFLEAATPVGGTEAGVAAELPSRLSELVSVRAELARTPRVLTLEKAITDETLAELIIRGEDATGFDSRLISQEINPIYDQISLRALQLESELKRPAGNRLADVSRALVALETVQLERSTGLSALLEQQSLELRLMRRQKSRALEDTRRERNTALTIRDRKLTQLRQLEVDLKSRFNSAVISRLFDQVDEVSLAAQATSGVATPRKIPLKSAFATVLGGLVGFAFSVVRPSRDS